MKTLKQRIGILMTCLLISISAFAQTENTISNRKPSMGILNIDTKGFSFDSSAMAYMTRLEVEKTTIYTVLDKYDMADVINKNGIDINNCYGKTCLVEAGKKLQADKMLSGNVERFADKIVITLRLIDVKTESVEKSDATEYLDMETEVQKMIAISVNKLFGLENDQNMMDLLVDYNKPFVSPTTTLKLNGPRMGASMVVGDAAERIKASKSEGGFEMSPFNTQFGLQLEKQYLSSGNFQALVEFIGLIGGLEQGKAIPSITLMNGFRLNNSGWEFAFGPVFKVVKVGNGYYANEDGGDGKWHLEHEWDQRTENPNVITEQLDSRGSFKAKTNLVIAIGKTFKSGYLNIPLNVYVIPSKKGTVIGMSLGFNINKKAKNG